LKNKHNVCVVGAGKWGLNHVRTLQSLNALGGVVELNKDIIESVKIKYPKCKIFSNLDDTFNEDFDGYIIATPPVTHFDLAMKVISNKKPLLVEKPITLDYNSSVKLSEYAREMNVNLMVGHILLFHPAFQKMKEIIDDGLLGEIQYIYSNRLNLGTFRTNENVFWSFAPHDIALFNYFFQKKPKSIFSKGVDILQENIQDSTITSFKYEGNKMGHIFVSWLHPFKEHRFVIIGSNGMLHFEDSVEGEPLVFYDKKAELINSILSPKFGESKRIKYKSEDALANELKYFISKFDGGEIEISCGESASQVIKILEQATKSLNENN
jgi:UDP-2-acetamido-3-amino-2,3-dideoxy-glucuronate N-acetyltransferase